MPGPSSHLEQDAELHLRVAGVPAWQRDYVFHPTRKWELDFAWPQLLVYLSIEGGVGKSSHRGIRPVYRTKTIGGRQIKTKVGMRDGLAEDLEKHNEAAIMGWLGVRATGSMLANGKAVEALKRAIALRQSDPF